MDSNTLELLKRMAMADGVLSNNEKELFRSSFEMTDEEAEAFFAEIEAELESVQSETEVIDWKRKNGLDFEKFVVSKFPSNFTIKSWTGDKFVDGKFDQKNLNPDITVEVTAPTQSMEIAIECKFHMGFSNDLIFVAKDSQLGRYRRFQEEKGIPTFIALGVGGSGMNPEELFVIPLNSLKFPVAKRAYLRQFQKDVRRKLFFYLSKKTFR